MVPVLCEFSLTSTPFGPVPTVLLVLLSGYWAWALSTKQPVERPVWKLFGVIGLVIGSSMLLGFDSNSAAIGGSGGTFGEMIASGISSNQLVVPTVILLILAVLASLPVATDWFFLPTLTRIRAARALETEPSLGSVGRYQVRGGYAHGDAASGIEGGAGVAVLDEEEDEDDEEEEDDDESYEDGEEEDDSDLSRGPATDPGAVDSKHAPDADDDDDDDDAAAAVADDDDDDDDEFAAPRSATLGLTQRVEPSEAEDEEDVEAEAEAEVPWYSRRTRRPWYEQDAAVRADDEGESTLDQDDEVEQDEQVEAEYESEESGEEAEYEEGSDEEEEELEDGADEEVEAEYEEPESGEAESESDEEESDEDVEVEYEEEDDEEEDEDDVEVEYEEELEAESDEDVEVETEAEAESDEEESDEEETDEEESDEAESDEVEAEYDEDEDEDETSPSVSAAQSSPAEVPVASRAPARVTEDQLFLQAGDLAVDEGRASISFLQRSMGVGYFQAAKLLDRLQKEAVIGGYTGAVNRDVLLDKTQWSERRSTFE